MWHWDLYQDKEEVRRPGKSWSKHSSLTSQVEVYSPTDAVIFLRAPAADNAEILFFLLNFFHIDLFPNVFATERRAGLVPAGLLSW